MRFLEKVKKVWPSRDEKSNLATELRVNILQLLVPEFSHAQVVGAGLKCGRDLYNTARNHAANGGGGFSLGDRNRGRAAHKLADSTEEDWEKISFPSRKTNTAGDSVRRVFGSLRSEALEISRARGVSVSTAYRHKPKTVVRSKSLKDLCIYCEALLRLRRDAVSLANSMGAEFEETPEECGQHAAKAPGKGAAAFLRGHEAALEEAGVDLLRHIAILEKHEDLADALRSELRSDISAAVEGDGSTVVVQFDFRSVLELNPIRGDSWEYYRAKKLSVLGMACYLSGSNHPVFIDVFSPDLRHDAEAAAVALVEGTKYLLNKMAAGANVAKISWWSDCAKHFRNRYIAYELLVGNFADINTAAMRFLGENHGKSVVDGHFNWLGGCAKDYNSKWDDVPADLVKAAQKSLREAPKHYNVIPLYFDKLELDHENTYLNFQDISAVHRVERAGDSIFVENKQVPKKVVRKNIERQQRGKRRPKPRCDDLCNFLDKKFKKRRAFLP